MKRPSKRRNAAPLKLLTLLPVFTGPVQPIFANKASTSSSSVLQPWLGKWQVAGPKPTKRRETTTKRRNEFETTKLRRNAAKRQNAAPLQPLQQGLTTSGLTVQAQAFANHSSPVQAISTQSQSSNTGQYKLTSKRPSHCNSLQYCWPSYLSNHLAFEAHS